MSPKKIKLAVIGHRGFPGVQGGVEKHCEAIIPLLAKDMDITVYRRKPYLNAQSYGSSIQNIRYIDLPSTRIKGFEALFHTFISCIHILLHRTDIVNVHNIGPGLFIPILRLFRIKVILTYHSANYEHQKWNKYAKYLLRLCEYISLKSANRIIFVNKFQMQKYNEVIQQKSIYIPNGIPTITKPDKIDFLEKHHITPNNYILAVGRLTPEKGFDILIKAITQIKQPITLVIAGASDHDSSYLDRLKELDLKNRVIFTGFTTSENLSQLYANAQLFVLSSINEGFPLVLLEAMSYNLPLVVTDIPATHLVKLSSANYVKANDIKSLQAGIEFMVDNNQSPIYDLQDFQWTQIASKTKNIYLESV